MLTPERQKLILMELETKGNASVHDLKSLLQVSVDTVRRDLKTLEKQGKITRVHGGAVLKEEVVTNQAFEKRKRLFQDRKSELAKAAMEYVKEHQAISLNAGTTNIEVAKELALNFERLTIITNSLNVANVFTGKKEFTVIVTGGLLNHEEFSLYGRSISEEINQFNIDIAFLNINAISIEKGLTDFRQGEFEVINAMIESAAKTIVVADSSKYETVSYLKICDLDEIDFYITDSYLGDELLEKYKEKNVRIQKAYR
ncbi:DeoR/GlpR family DNA-binding transcription regulator [Evansella halocellulosilytica]|uniref:DeoR/GlpR family DNA-binding transcription regulator n=1 Tax=Evansella halocellulosilytica TaxID=2011013 RepID=UPI0015C6C58E|nr:DeoR/GlpR family DNA-binding transcription regulator [Evansella halocellulosilytica]